MKGTNREPYWKYIEKDKIALDYKSNNNIGILEEGNTILYL